jgi:uncharacterized protein YndB with AHSA1/START domain
MNLPKDRNQRKILLKAPRARIWRALSNTEEFGKWFGVALEGMSFRAGQRVQSHVTHPGYEHLIFDVLIERMEPETLLSWRWHPAAVNPKVDYSQEGPTLVEFKLQEVQDGTLLRVSESGFHQVPTGRRSEAFRLNSGGWDAQMDNIAKHFNAP